MRIGIGGVVQGVGFRPFVFRLANQRRIAGWVLNGADGVRIHAEGSRLDVERFIDALRTGAPQAAQIASFAVEAVAAVGFATFEIRDSRRDAAPTVRISPDLALCSDCRQELLDPDDRRFGYAYINCTNCGPRYSIVIALPYDRANTTMRDWPLCEPCRSEYDDPSNRRFHAQPVACANCGPAYRLHHDGRTSSDGPAVAGAAALLGAGAILAIKGIGGYHLACDARNMEAVQALRDRKYRKERPFAVMTTDLASARLLVEMDAEAEALLLSPARPIVLAPARVDLGLVAPDNRELGVMLPYAPLHEALFAAGAPNVLVLTSANRSSEPIAYQDDAAIETLGGIADAFLIGDRPIARRVDDSVVRAGPLGPTVLRRSRGMAPAAVAAIPCAQPLLAVGADLKNAVTLVVAGQAFASQHIGDLDHLGAREAFAATIADVCAIYGVDPANATVAHDLHPQYHSTEFARSLGQARVAVQHHRAHIASVLAERAAWHETVLGFAFDGTGYGDDGTIWGGEVFLGTLADGFERVAHLRTAPLPGGDAAARFPVQAAAGFLYGIADGVAFEDAPFCFGERYRLARQLVAKDVRAFTSTSAGRLFDTVAALAGFTREQTFEGQAAMWLEHQARSAPSVEPYFFHVTPNSMDFSPALRAAVSDRLSGRSPGEVARAFHQGLAEAVVAMAEARSARRVVVSGGVFQNALLLELLAKPLGERLWANRTVPPNDGGISLGQAALAAAAVASAR